jgi:ElaB/YqjD/DUF883 family membrane-anchored ribosome-binding protein
VIITIYSLLEVNDFMPEKSGTQTSGSTFSTENISDTAQNVKEKVTDAARKTKDKASDLGRQATEQVDAKRGPAAEGLESAASTLHEKAETLPGGETVRSVAHSTADKLESTAGYIREHDVKDMMSDVEDLVRRNPGPSLLIAATIGFFIGRAFRED